ncbi:MAG: cyclodeaminase/cyclohydrolase family protein [Anaerolineae bacterium]|nr:cyclodeaminase/cyclohydrolase family protein [Anaerolineae bacterium]
MNTLTNLDNFIDQLASGDPTPGGGSAAALAGAAGAALVAMVARLTVGRKRYIDAEPQMQEIMQRAETLRARLTDLVNEDAAAYNQVSAAYRLPKATGGEQAARAAAIQAGMQAASLTPLETAQACAEVISLAEQVVAQGNVNARTDGGVGALLAFAGLQGAVWNVEVNLPSIDDSGFVTTVQTATHEALAAGQASLDRVQRAVTGDQ